MPKSGGLSCRDAGYAPSGAYVTYTWDYHNRMTDVKFYTSASVLTEHLHYTYDVFDRLIQKQVDPTGGGTYTTSQSFVFGVSPPSEGGAGGVGSNVILVYNGSGTLTDRLLVTPSPLAGEGGGEGVLADENGSGVISWFLKDNEGTIRDVAQYNSGTNTTTVVNHLKYDSFGNITSQSNSAYPPLFAYTGQMWDAAAGLFYYHARWYDAHTGRFVSQDPIKFAAGDANLYRYLRNSPTNATDPTGLDTQPNPGIQSGAGANTGTNNTLQDVLDGAEALAEEEERQAARIRQILHIQPDRPGLLATDEEWERYSKEMDQWWRDEFNKPPETPPNLPPTNRGEHNPPPPRSPWEFEMGPVKQPTGPTPESEIKILHDMYETERFRLRWYYGSEFDDRGMPTRMGGGLDIIIRM